MNRTDISASIVSEPAGWLMEPHRHEGFEISVVWDGFGAFEAAGQISRLEQGNVVIIPAGIDHYYWSDTPIRFGVLLVEWMEPELLALLHRLTPPDQTRVILLPPNALVMYDMLFRSWIKTLSQPMVDAPGYVHAWLELILRFVEQHAAETPAPLSVRRASEYIRNHVQEEVRISQLSAMAGLSVSAFRKEFKQAMGVSPKQYQQQVRLEEAVWLLRASDSSILHIAERIGFSTLHAFSRWFQQAEGVSPSVWRNRQRGRS